MKHFFLRLLCLSLLFSGFTAPLAAQSPDTALFQETLRIGRGAVLHAEWDSTGTLILVDTVRGAWLYAPGGYHLPDVAHIEGARLARFNPARPLLAGVDDDNHITLWDTTTFEQVASLPGHDVYVRALAWNPDGSQLATLDRTGRIITWDTEQQVKSLELRSEGADQIAWSPGGVHLAAIDSTSGVIQVWNAAGELVLTTIPEYAGSYGFAMLWRDDTHLLRQAYDGEGGAGGKLLDIPSGSAVRFPDLGYINAYSPDGSKLVGRFSMLDADSGESLFTVPVGQAAAMVWSPDGRYIALGDWSADITAHTWVTIVDATTGKAVYMFRHDYTIKEIAWSPDSQMFLTVDAADQISVLRTVTPMSSNVTVPDTIAHTEIGTTAAWRGDGKIIAAADTNYGARLWDAQTGQVLVPRMHGGQPFTRLAWQPGGTLLAATGGSRWQSKNNNVYIWDSGAITESSAAHVLTIPHVDIVAGIAWSPDGRTLASAERSQYIRLWQPDESTLIRVMDTYAIRLAPFIDYTQQINSLAWSPHGDLLDYSFSSSGNGGGVDLLDVNAGTLVSGDTPNNYASTWVWTPDNRLIWANWGFLGDGASPEPRPPIHDITLGGVGIGGEGEPVLLAGLTEEIRTAVFSPDARLLIGFDRLDNGMIWDVQTRTPLAHLPAVDNAVWSPDSTMLAIYGTDGLIRVLDPQTGATLHTFNRHFYIHTYDPAKNIQLIWSPDSQRVIVLDNGVLFIYDRQG